MKKRILSVLLTCLLLIELIVPAFDAYADNKGNGPEDTITVEETADVPLPEAEEEPTAEVEQTASDCIWIFDEDLGLMTLYGEDSVLSGNGDWLAKSGSVQTILLDGRFSSIESGALRACENLQRVLFLNDAPEFREDCFKDLELTIFYPSDNESWTEDLLQDHGGKIDWRALPADQIKALANEELPAPETLTDETSEEESAQTEEPQIPEETQDPEETQAPEESEEPVTETETTTGQEPEQPEETPSAQETDTPETTESEPETETDPTKEQPPVISIPGGISQTFSVLPGEPALSELPEAEGSEPAEVQDLQAERSDLIVDHIVVGTLTPGVSLNGYSLQIITQGALPVPETILNTEEEELPFTVDEETVTLVFPETAVAPYDLYTFCELSNTAETEKGATVTVKLVSSEGLSGEDAEWTNVQLVNFIQEEHMLSWEEWYAAATAYLDLTELSETEFKELYVRLHEQYAAYMAEWKAAAEPDGEKSTGGRRAASSGIQQGGGTFANEYIEVAISDTGQFTMGTVEGDPNYTSDNNANLLFGHANPSTSETLIKVGDDEYIFMASEVSIVRTDSRAVATMKIDQDGHDLEIKEELVLVKRDGVDYKDQVDIKYTVKNNGSKKEEVGIRIMLDTMLGRNDAAPFSIPGQGKVVTIKTFTGASIPAYYQVYDNLDNPSILATGYLTGIGSRNPDKVQFTNWGGIRGSSWSHDPADGGDLGDSAVGIYYNPVSVSSGKSFSVATRYGVGVGKHGGATGSGIDKNHVQIKVINAVSGSPIKGATVTTSDGTGHQTADDGLVLLDLAIADNKEIQASCSGYKNKSINLDMEGGRQYTIKMKKAGDTTPVIERVMFTGVDGKAVDLLTNSVRYAEDTSKILGKKSNSGKVRTVKLQIQSDTSNCTYYLYKDGQQIKKNRTGLFEFRSMPGHHGDYPYISDLTAGKKYNVKCVSDDNKSASGRILLEIYSPRLSVHGDLIDDLENSSLNLFPTTTADIGDNFLVRLIAGGTNKFKIGSGKWSVAPIVSYDTHSKKLKVGLNVDRNFIDNQQATNLYSNYVDKVYKNDTEANKKELKNAMKRWRKSGKSTYKVGTFSSDINFMGYGEFTPDSDNKWHGTIYASISWDVAGSTSWNSPVIPMTAVPIPCYLTLGVEGKLELTFARGVDFGDARDFVDEILKAFNKFNFYFGGFVEVGVGNSYAAKVGGKIQVGINFDYYFQTTYLKLSLKFKGSIVWKALFWSGSHPIAEAEIKIIDRYLNSKSPNRAQQPKLRMEDLIDPDNMVLESRDYSAKSNGLTDDDLTLDDKVYSEAQPTLIRVGDDEYSFWLNDMADREAQNRTAIVYSVNGGETLVLDDDGTADFDFDVAVNGTDLIIVWMDCGEVLASDATLSEAWMNMDLTMARLNTVTGAVEIIPITLNNGASEQQPAVYAANGKAYVVWNSMTSGPFEEVENNKLNYCVYNGTSVGETSSIALDSRIVGDVQIRSKNGVPTAAYTMTSWDDVSEEESQTTHYLSLADGTVSSGTIGNSEYIPVSGSLDGADKIFWYQEGNIYYTDFGQGQEDARTVFEEEEAPETLGGSFIVVPMAGRTYLIWVYGTETEEGDNLPKTAYACVYQNGSWGEAYQIADLGYGAVEGLTGIEDENGELVLSWQQSQYDEEGNLEYTELRREYIDGFTDLALTDVEYDPAGAAKGEAYTFQVVLKNNGSTVIDAAEVNVDGAEPVYLEELALAPGESVTKDVTIAVPYSGEYPYHVSVYADGDMNGWNNDDSFTIGQTMLRIVPHDSVMYDNDTAQLVEIANDAGFDTDGITIRIYADDEGGVLLYQCNVGTVEQKSSMFISVPAEIYDDTDTGYAYLLIAPEDEEEEEQIGPVILTYGTSTVHTIDSYTMTVEEPEHGQIAALNEKYEEGETIALSATAEEGYAFWQWTADTGEDFADPFSAETTFVMPADDVILTAEFREILPAESISVDVPEETVGGEPIPDPANIEIEPGDAFMVTTAAIPANSSDHVFVTSSDEAVCTVDEDGIIMAVAPGQAVITISCGNVEARTINVTVKEVPLTGIALRDLNDSATVFMRNVGSTELMELDLTPANATGEVVWSSSDETVAVVSQEGVITAVSCGQAVITAASADDPEAVTASCTVIITAKVEAVELSESMLTVHKGETENLTVTFVPTASARIDEISWAYDEDLIRVEPIEGTNEIGVTGLAAGNTAIVATILSDGEEYTAICQVTVDVQAQSIAFAESSITVRNGRYFSNDLIVLPEDATTEITYSSSDSGVVYRYGDEFRATGVGTATVTARTDNGLEDSFTVVVEPAVTYAETIEELQSEHDYQNSIEETWYYTLEGACGLGIVFSENTYTESGYDYIRIYDKEADLIGEYCGDELVGATVNVPGDTVRIVLDTDSSATYYGFAVTRVDRIHIPEVVPATPATLTTNGKTEGVRCAVCGEWITKQKTIPKVTGFKLSATSYVYNGKAKSPTVTVTDSAGTALVKDRDYKVTLPTKRTAVGTYSVTVQLTGNYIGTKTLTFKIVPAKPVISKVENVSTGTRVTWKKAAGAGGYYVYRKTGSGSFTKVKTITSASTLTFTDTKAKTNGTKYTYYVIAYKTVSGTTYKSAKSAEKISYFVSRPTISSAANTAAKKITVKWGRNAKATGYEVKYVVGSTTKTVTITKNATVSKVITGLTKGKTYKVYVRSYKTVGSTKYYSAWSAVKSVKVTK